MFNKYSNLKTRVLIVDDSKDIQGLLTILLESKGYTVECSDNGEDALNFLNSSVILPDLILLDVNMPRMDGPSFLKFQSATLSLKDIPVVVMSGDEEMDLIVANVEVLTKPLDIESVIASVEKITSRRKQRLQTNVFIR